MSSSAYISRCSGGLAITLMPPMQWLLGPRTECVACRAHVTRIRVHPAGYAHDMWFDTWSNVLRILLVGPASYAIVVLILRTSGKRTLAKLNAFDLVVTVALGSTLATIFLSKDVSWSEGAVALGLLALLQFLLASFTARWPAARSVVTSRPTVLVKDGRLLEDELRQQRLTHTEVWQAVRASGVGDVRAVAAVVLEADGTLSVIPAAKVGDGSALADVERWYNDRGQEGP